jgi:YHS domain-containing protein
MHTDSHGVRFEALNWVASTPLQRDKEQSHLLHQPDHLFGTIDPITGHDIGELAGHPSVVDGKLRVYFESEVTRAAFLKMPVNHPCGRVPGASDVLVDRGG